MWPFNRGYPIRTIESIANQSFDYIVVGGGTAGCALAARLSEDSSVTVLLLERGPVVDTFVSKVPLMSFDFRHSSSPTYKWRASPLSIAPDNEPLEMVTGRLLGGSSKVNAQLYTRGVPGEYNAWSEAGRKGWGWTDVEPFFKKSERTLLPSPTSNRGLQGEWKTRRLNSTLFKLTHAVVKATTSLGIPYLTDFNNPDSPPVVCSRVDLTMDERGRRHSTFDAFLPRRVASSRPNLYVCTEILVTKLDIQQTNKGPRAVGVFFRRDSAHSEGQPMHHYRVSAVREIVLCAGAIADPQLLLLSGIGPKGHLDSHGIPLVKDLPGVGSHFQDHPSVPLVFKVPVRETLYKLQQNKFVALAELLKFTFAGKGLFTLPCPQMFVFASSKHLNDNSETVLSDTSVNDAHRPDNIPDIETMQTPCSSLINHAIPRNQGAASLFCAILKPHSKGTVRLASIDPSVRPTCDLGFLTDPRDWVIMRKALRLGLSIARRVKDDGYPLERMLQPDGESDEELDAFIRKYAQTIYHYSSTCRMAPEAEEGVVDDELRVHGVHGLRVADASIFPDIPGTHTQAPTVMVAERCADFIVKGRK